MRPWFRAATLRPSKPNYRRHEQKVEIIKESLRSIRNIAEGTVGSMAASGIVAGVAKLLGMSSGERMSSLVEELQRDALDSKINVSDLLRKSLVVATKLNLADFRKWVECELNGYGKDDGLPDYRLIRCQVQSTNPFDRRKIPWKFPTSRP